MKLIRPMLATLSPGIVEGPEWVFEEKYDGIRAVAGLFVRALQADSGPLFFGQAPDQNLGICRSHRPCQSDNAEGQSANH